MKATVISIIAASLLIAGAIVYASGGGGGSSSGDSGSANNISIENGKQIITITARGGYAPRNTSAKAGIPTVIRMITNGTYDCSMALSIPAIGYRSYLPQTGSTDIDVPAQESGMDLRGTCAMGMYNFSINFN